MIPRRRTPIGLVGIARAIAAARRGDPIADFEARVAEYTGRAHAIATCSGRAALCAALDARGLAAGDEVILPAYTLADLPALLARRGLHPVFADISPGTFLIDPKAVAAALSPRTRAVIPTDLFGAAIDWEAALRPSLPPGVLLIEDAAHAIGSRASGAPAGAHAEAAFFSLETIKVLHSFGGGVLVTDDRALADASRASRSTALPGPGYLPAKVARNLVENLAFRTPAYSAALRAMGSPRLRDALISAYTKVRDRGVLTETAYTPFQAAFAAAELARLGEQVTRRRAAAAALTSAIGPAVEWQAEPPGCASNRYFLVGLAPRGVDPAQLRRALLGHGVDLGVGAEITDLCVPERDRARFPVAAEVFARAIQLPLFDRMPERAIARIARALRTELAARI